MSIASKYNKITCEKYGQIPGSKKCKHYNKGGYCSLPEEHMCSEWLKKNADKEEKQKDDRIDLGVPTRVGANDGEFDGRPRIVIAREEQKSDEPYVIPDSDIDELEKTGMTMILSADEFEEEVFVVPSYTDEKDSRIELTWRDLATITTMVSVFPGSRVVRVRKNRR